MSMRARITMDDEERRRFLKGEPDEQARAGIAQQARKRVVPRFTPTRIASWDHRKLG